MNFDDIEIKSIEKLNVQNGDVLFVYTKNYLPEATRDDIKATLGEVFLSLDKNVKIVVIHGDEIKLQVIRTEDDHT